MKIWEIYNFENNLMKKIKCFCLVLCCCLCFSFTADAQDNYSEALGFRGGPLSGISYKRFIGLHPVIEGIVGFNFTNGRLISVTGLYEYHNFINYNANYFFGGGLTIAANSNDFNTAAELILGFDYTFTKVPVNFSLDYKPNYKIFDNKFIFNEFALSLRYLLQR